jgi:hypothetical protein
VGYSRERKRERDPAGECGWPRGSRSFASSSAPRRDRASVASGLGRKSCPQGQLATGDDTPFRGRTNRDAHLPSARDMLARPMRCEMGEHRRAKRAASTARAYARTPRAPTIASPTYTPPWHTTTSTALGRIASARAAPTRHDHVDCRRDAAGGRATHASRRERFTDVEDVINASDLATDEKSALWLLGWSCVHPRAQRREGRHPPQPNDGRHTTADDELRSISPRRRLTAGTSKHLPGRRRAGRPSRDADGPARPESLHPRRHGRGQRSAPAGST